MMRLGLVGCTGHWRSYAEALRTLPDLEIAAVAPAAPEETLAAFDGAPGVENATRRLDSPAALLDLGGIDVVQVSTRSDLIPGLVRAALDRRLPVMAEKPIAGTLEDLAALHRLAGDVDVVVAEGVAAELIGSTVFGDRVTDLAPVPRLAGTPRVVVRARTVFGDLRLRSLAPGQSADRWRALLERFAGRVLPPPPPPAPLPPG
jgi:hypothetical protein